MNVCFIVANLNCILGLTLSEANRIVPLGVRLREFGNNRKIHIVPLESVRGCLLEWPLTGMCKYRVCMRVQMGFCQGSCK